MNDIPNLLSELDPDRLGPWLRPLFVEGLEVTQAIQTFRSAAHLTLPEHHLPDNAMPIVAEKAACVRVHLRSRLRDVADVSAVAILQRRALLGWQDVVELQARGPARVLVRAREPYADRRRDSGDVLSFFVPAALVVGHFRVRVEVRAPGQEPITEMVSVDARLRQQLRVRVVPVRYVGPDANGVPADLPAPTRAEALTTLAATLRWFPVTATPEVAMAAELRLAEPLTGAMAAGSCPLSWQRLLDQVARVRALDGRGPGWLYYALLPQGVPVGDGDGDPSDDTVGCGGGGVAAGFVGHGPAMAHELGHACGLRHAPAGLPADDQSWVGFPDRPPYDVPGGANRASIGDYGYDPDTGQVWDPAWAKDFMSYQGPQWISVHHHLALVRNPALNPEYRSYAERPLRVVERTDYRRDRDLPYPPPGRLELVRRPRVVVRGEVVRGEVALRSVDRVESAAYGVATAAAPVVPGLVAQLVDPDGSLLSESMVRDVGGQACGCGGGGTHHGCGAIATPGVRRALARPDASGAFEVVLDASDLDAGLRIVRGGEVVLEVRPTERTPWASLEVDERDDGLVLRWDPHRDDVAVGAQWSSDGGETWSALGAGLTGGEAWVAATCLPAAPVLVRLVLSDGWQTGHSDAVEVQVPGRAPECSVVFPPQHALLGTDETPRLWGTALDDQLRPLSGEALEWRVDGEVVGSGSEVLLSGPLPEGRHTVELVARDAAGESTASVDVGVEPLV